MSIQQTSQVKKQKAYKYMEKGKLRDAITILERLTKSVPADPEVLYMLGCNYARLCQWGEAIKTLQASIQAQSNVPQSHFALAGVYIALGRLEEAFNCLELTIKLNNKLPDAFVAKGNILTAWGNIPEASECFETALKIDPFFSDAYLGLAGIEQEKGLYPVAIDYIEKSLKYDAKNVRALCAMATSLANLTQKEEAIKYYKKALRYDPDSIDAICGLAMMYNFNGEYAETEKLINPLLKKNILHSTLGVAFAQCCEQSNRCREAVDYINKVAANDGGVTRSSLKNIHFAAAKVLDKMKLYDEAFSHYKAANEATRQIYDGVEHAHKISKFIEVFGPGLFMKVPRSEINDDRPIFIVGMPRSGTSLTEQILGSHPDVYPSGELSDLSAILDVTSIVSGENKGILHFVDNMSQEQVNAMARQYLDKLTELSPSAKRITDKMPHNFYLLGLIQILFPSARIIHCRRDPLDTCLSIYFQNFNEHHLYAKSLFDIGTHYHQYERLMEHWKNVLTIPMFEVVYEDLVSDQETVVRQLLNFCGLDWSDDCMQFHKLDRTIDTASFDQVRQPLYKKSVQRWQNYEKYIDDLKVGLTREY